MPFDPTILMIVAMGAVFYFMLIRPQQKRAKAQAEMTNSVAAGSRVMLTAGIVGTVKHVGERQAIVEISPGVEMTIFKAAIAKVLSASDDEFEYADDDVADPVPDEPPAAGQGPSPFADPARPASAAADSSVVPEYGPEYGWSDDPNQDQPKN